MRAGQGRAQSPFRRRRPETEAPKRAFNGLPGLEDGLEVFTHGVLEQGCCGALGLQRGGPPGPSGSPGQVGSRRRLLEHLRLELLHPRPGRRERLCQPEGCAGYEDTGLASLLPAASQGRAGQEARAAIVDGPCPCQCALSPCLSTPRPQAAHKAFLARRGSFILINYLPDPQRGLG